MVFFFSNVMVFDILFDGIFRTCLLVAWFLPQLLTSIRLQVFVIGNFVNINLGHFISLWPFEIGYWFIPLRIEVTIVVGCFIETFWIFRFRLVEDDSEPNNARGKKSNVLLRNAKTENRIKIRRVVKSGVRMESLGSICAKSVPYRFRDSAVRFCWEKGKRRKKFGNERGTIQFRSQRGFRCFILEDYTRIVREKYLNGVYKIPDVPDRAYARVHLWFYRQKFTLA